MEQVPTRQIAFVAENQVEVQDRSLAAPAPTELQVRTTRTLISAGTELDYLNGVIPGRVRPEVRYPVYHGYSNVGQVVACGCEVTDFVKGDRVLTMGPHASHHNVAASSAVRVPVTVSDEAATFAVLGSVALHGIRRAPLEIGDCVLVIGDGLVGQLTVQLAMLQGARPVALAGHYPLRLDLARQVGVAQTWDERLVDVPTAFRHLSGGQLADIVYETAGRVVALELAFRAARLAGTVVMLGGIRQKAILEPPIFYHQFQARDLTLMAASQTVRPELESNYFHWTQKRNRELFVKLVAQGSLHVEHLITQRIPFEQAAQGYDLLANRRDIALGVILEWT